MIIFREKMDQIKVAPNFNSLCMDFSRAVINILIPQR